MKLTLSRLSVALLLAGVAGGANAQVVVSQVYGGGGNTGAPYNRDYVELFNRGSASVSLNGMTVQYASATGTGNFSVGATLPNVTLAPGQYFLVGMASGANGAALPTVDASGTSAMSGTAGKVILANSTTALACNGGSTACSSAQTSLILDLVGFGTANFFEGTAAARGGNRILGWQAAPARRSTPAPRAVRTSRSRTATRSVRTSRATPRTSHRRRRATGSARRGCARSRSPSRPWSSAPAPRS